MYVYSEKKRESELKDISDDGIEYDPDEDNRSSRRKCFR